VKPIKHLTLVLHGARADRADVRHLVRWVRRRGHRLDVRVTWDAGDAMWQAAEAADAGADTVIAAGGDGTLNEVLNGLDGRNTALGIIPLGTANDFARQLGIPSDADHAMDVILQRKPALMDTASLNGRRFLNVSTGGVGAEATAETPTEAKAALGALAYAITGIRKLAELPASRATFRSDGLRLDCEYLMFAVGNARATGGGTIVAPRAEVNDGLLDVCVVEAMPRADFARIALKTRTGDHLDLPGVHYVQVPWLRIEGHNALSVNVDGESSDARVLHYRARARDLRVHAVRLPGEDTTETETAGR